MKKRVGFIVALIITAVCGCAQNATQNGYTVMFDGSLYLSDQGVYYNGMQVGTVQSVDTKGANVTRVLISPNSDFADQVSNNLVLYAHAGRLHVDKLASLGNTISHDVPLSGFVSKSDLNWFKFKTLLSDRVSAAKKRAVALQAQFS